MTQRWFWFAGGTLSFSYYACFFINAFINLRNETRSAYSKRLFICLATGATGSLLLVVNSIVSFFSHTRPLTSDLGILGIGLTLWATYQYQRLLRRLA
ncbi:MAG TPA: hypothetical protein VGU46_13680 [Acidobacteriaceae bacterium]|nr:hypothetical protein [Acidobacteriaceae bacterium]